ncbi:MAG: type II toxin-antitoxin system VapC family toxin [Sporichthyaceae bacterium]
MAYYLDTSAFLKLVVEEEHSAALRSWNAEIDPEVFSTDLLRTEALRTARRHSPAALLAARRHLDSVTLLSLSTALCERAAELDPSILRALDALHLAGALTAGDDLKALITYDHRLADAAARHGIEVIAPGQIRS